MTSTNCFFKIIIPPPVVECPFAQLRMNLRSTDSITDYGYSKLYFCEYILLTCLWLVIEYNESIQPSPNLKREGVDWSQSKVIFITRVYK